MIPVLIRAGWLDYSRLHSRLWGGGGLSIKSIMALSETSVISWNNFINIFQFHKTEIFYRSQLLWTFPIGFNMEKLKNSIIPCVIGLIFNFPPVRKVGVWHFVWFIPPIKIFVWLKQEQRQRCDHAQQAPWNYLGQIGQKYFMDGYSVVLD